MVLGSPMRRIGTATAAHIADAVVRSLHHWNRSDGVCDPWISNGLGVRVHCGENLCERHSPQIILAT